ncbi:hypothetical protein CVIRNUC_006249 [Coccomyxa viridis]|uniref:Uncharacterized protein n=1 Tax=Coccomyxa viridis TaxID=1274662 RepID=A0AAV1I7K5_9CHLO|nr:hypothetical protein CVIRNUC_006249 [Coccomyxa viridis]
MPAPDRQPAEAGPAAVLKSKAPTWLPSAHAIYFYCLWLPTALLFLLTKMFDGKGILYLLSSCGFGLQLILIGLTANFACAKWSRAARHPLITAFSVGLICTAICSCICPAMVDVALIGPRLSVTVRVPQAMHAWIASPSAAPYIAHGYAAIGLVWRMLLAALTFKLIWQRIRRHAQPKLAARPTERDMITQPEGHSPGYTDAGSALQAPAVHVKQAEYAEVLEEMEEEDSGKERSTLDGEQASADVAIDVAKVDGPLDIASAPALKRSAEEKSMLQSTDPDRDVTPSSAAIKKDELTLWLERYGATFRVQKAEQQADRGVGFDAPKTKSTVETATSQVDEAAPAAEAVAAEAPDVTVSSEKAEAAVMRGAEKAAAAPNIAGLEAPDETASSQEADVTAHEDDSKAAEVEASGETISSWVADVAKKEDVDEAAAAKEADEGQTAQSERQRVYLTQAIVRSSNRMTHIKEDLLRHHWTPESLQMLNEERDRRQNLMHELEALDTPGPAHGLVHDAPGSSDVDTISNQEDASIHQDLPEANASAEPTEPAEPPVAKEPTDDTDAFTVNIESIGAVPEDRTSMPAKADVWIQWEEP